MNAPTNTQLAEALRAILVLTPYERSADREFRPLAGIAGVPEAIDAARRGDIDMLDTIEIAWLNAWGPKPTPPEAVPQLLLDDWGWALFALEILHGGNGTRIRWGYAEPCPRCGKHIALRPGCWRCASRAWRRTPGRDADPIWCFLTDTELRVIPDTLRDCCGLE